MCEDDPKNKNNGAPEFSGCQILGPGSDSEPWNGIYTPEGSMDDEKFAKRWREEYLKENGFPWDPMAADY